MAAAEIHYYDRYRHEYQVEKVYGEAAIRYLYTTSAGQGLVPIVGSKVVSSLYGKLQDTGFSRFKVPRFIRDYGIQIHEYRPGGISGMPIEHSFRNFNEFFTRQFVDGARPFNSDDNVLCAFAEGRYAATENLTDETTFPIKGTSLNPIDLLGGAEWAEEFRGGICIVARLCPVDYHRFHFPCDVNIERQYTIEGKLLSVNPLALKAYPEVFLQNERQITLMESDVFGKIALIDVGATCVGRIEQTYDQNSRVAKKGEEKGMFLFGGSTTIMLATPGSMKLSRDLVDQSAKGHEVFIKLGDRLASKV